MRSAALIASSLFTAATVLPLIKREAWWIRLLDFPRPQITLGALASACALSIAQRRRSRLDNAAFTVLGVVTAYQAWEMARYTRLRRVQSLRAESSDETRRVRILTANVLQSNRNAQQYLELIAQCDPDVVVLAEADAFWEEQMRVIEEAYPHTMKCPLENTYGLALYSRLPLHDQQVLFRVEEDVPSLSAVVSLRNGDPFQLHVLHPRPPHIGVDTVERDAELVVVAKQVKDTELPVIVTGDLNDVAWSHTTRLFLRISGLLDPRLGRTFCNTFHSHYPVFRWPLDHLFHSRAFRLVKFERGPQTDSDHFPVIVELSYEPEVRHEQEKPLPEQEDFEEAHRKLETAVENGAGGEPLEYTVLNERDRISTSSRHV